MGMDCSKTEVFFAELGRMCRNTKCGECEIKKLKHEDMECISWVCENIKTAIKIAQEWSDRHPVKTRLSVLKEQYPNATMNAAIGIVPDVCAGMLYGFVGGRDICTGDCIECWNTPVKEGK